MVILLALVAALQVVSIPLQFATHSRAQDYKEVYLANPKPAETAERAAQQQWEDAITPTLNKLRDSQTVYSSVTGIQMGGMLAIAIMTMIWMRRMILNHRLFGRPFSTWTPGWAIGGWFLPPGGIYAIPWLIFKELWRGSDPANEPNDPSWKQRPVSPLIHLWWALFGLVPIIGTIAGSGVLFGLGTTATSGSSDPTEWFNHAKVQVSAFPVLLAVAIVGVITPLVYAKLVRDLTKRQQAFTREV